MRLISTAVLYKLIVSFILKAFLIQPVLCSFFGLSGIKSES